MEMTKHQRPHITKLLLFEKVSHYVAQVSLKPPAPLSQVLELQIQVATFGCLVYLY